MPTPSTLLSLAGADPAPATLDASVVILIDYQNEYLDGTLALPGATAAVQRAAALLEQARQAKAPIIHVAHKGAPGGLFDRSDRRGAFIENLSPQDGEVVIEKRLPNAFAGTELADTLALHQRTTLIVAGFMTHMCVSATVRSAVDHGYFSTVIADACATRALPDHAGGVIEADILHTAALAALGDRFAVIA